MDDQAGKEAIPASSEPVDVDIDVDGDGDADPESVAREIVLGKLSAQARTRQELATALKRRNVDEQTAENVLNRLQEVGLVDDEAFAISWVNSRQRRRRLSKRALGQELARKGVDRELVDAALDEVTSADEYAAARDLVHSKMASLTGLDRKVQYRRLAGALGRRGFSAEISGQIITQVMSDGDAVESPGIPVGEEPEII